MVTWETEHTPGRDSFEKNAVLSKPRLGQRHWDGVQGCRASSSTVCILNDLNASEDVLSKIVSDGSEVFSRYDSNIYSPCRWRGSIILDFTATNKYKQTFYCFSCILKVNILRVYQNTPFGNFIKKIWESTLRNVIHSNTKFEGNIVDKCSF